MIGLPAHETQQQPCTLLQPAGKIQQHLPRVQLCRAAAQKYGIGEYDVLLATNVLHATRNMPNTLQNCKALLRKGGLLIANELSAKTEFLTLTFGLTDGWWLHDETGTRIPGSPLISRQTNRSSCVPCAVLHAFMNTRACCVMSCQKEVWHAEAGLC